MKLRLRVMREETGYTQKQISKYLFCDQSLYSKYERGERAVPLAVIMKLADFYKVNINYLISLSDSKELY